MRSRMSPNAARTMAGSTVDVARRAAVPAVVRVTEGLRGDGLRVRRDQQDDRRYRGHAAGEAVAQAGEQRRADQRKGDPAERLQRTGTQVGRGLLEVRVEL